MADCKHCHMDIAIRNPSGYCDHLHYPEACKVCSDAEQHKHHALSCSECMSEFHALRQRVSELEAQVAEARKQNVYPVACCYHPREMTCERPLVLICPTQHKFLMQLEQERDTALADSKRLREALERYGDHIGECWEYVGVPGHKCTCGLDAALNGGK